MQALPIIRSKEIPQTGKESLPAGGECKVYYDSASAVIVFDWKGKSTADSTINWNENLHDILEKTDILPNLKNNQNFEIDSKCPNSSMVPKVKEQIGSDSLLNNGTWAFLGSSTNKSNRYLFWTIGRCQYKGRRCGQADTGHYQPGGRRLLHLRNDHRDPS